MTKGRKTIKKINVLANSATERLRNSVDSRFDGFFLLKNLRLCLSQILENTKTNVYQNRVNFDWNSQQTSFRFHLEPPRSTALVKRHLQPEFPRKSAQENILVVEGQGQGLWEFYSKLLHQSHDSRDNQKFLFFTITCNFFSSFELSLDTVTKLPNFSLLVPDAFLFMKRRSSGLGVNLLMLWWSERLLSN